MRIVTLFAAALVVCIGSFGTSTSHAVVTTAVPAHTPGDKPAYNAYKGVTIGMSATEVRSKLGGPKDKSDEQDSFEFSSRESAQVYYDSATHTVTAVMVSYTGDLKGIPTPKDIFGEELPPRPDGGFYKKVDYHDAGFWVSYNKTPGDEPMVIIVLNKM
jgi:hypothetical protein